MEDTPEFRPRKRRKIIIHTSPYLRCLQTSIAIGAGLQSSSVAMPVPGRRQHSSLSHISTVDNDSADLQNLSIDTSVRPDLITEQITKSVRERPMLKIDAVLGEWLSATYFEHTEKPPSSKEMVSSAKTILHTPAEELKGVDFLSSIKDISTIDWQEKENEASLIPTREKTGLRAMALYGASAPGRTRHLSFGADVANAARNIQTSLRKQQQNIYSPPIPTYAMAPQDPIPPGFVAHARDSCLDIDFEWDSMMEPLDWGDGGPFDEEWSSMHRRLRNGLQKMLAYYEQTDSTGSDTASTENDEEQLVLILVTHQACCNALIRLITGAPSLHDIGTASLTLAIRKETNQDSEVIQTRPPDSRRGSLDTNIAEDFDMKIIASTEHLRGGSNPLGLNSPRLGHSPAFASPRTAGPDSLDGFSIGESFSWRSSSAQGLGRKSSQRSHVANTGTSGPQGLWGSGNRLAKRNSSDMRDSRSASVGTNTDSIPEELAVDDTTEAKANIGHRPARSASQLGLWGAEPLKRERSPGKRRWTDIDKY